MRILQSERGFRWLLHPAYTTGQEGQLVAESSAIGDYEDSWSSPGSSFLWVTRTFHLNREEVAELVGFLQFWLDNKRLPEEKEAQG